MKMQLVGVQIRKYRSFGTPPRLTLQARLLHNKRVPRPKRAVFEGSRGELYLNVSVGVHILLAVEQSSLESQSRGCQDSDTYGNFILSTQKSYSARVMRLLSVCGLESRRC